LGNDIVKSNKIIGKLFADDGAYEGNNIFKCLTDNGILPCIKIRNNAKSRMEKKRTSIETYQSYPRKMICKSGKITKAMEKDGLSKRYSHL
jgi:hypothetical protein